MSIALFGDPLALAPARTERIARADGTFVLKHPEALQAHARCVGEWLEHWAAATPDAPFLSERNASGGWRRLHYAQVREQVGRIGQALLDMELPAGQPVVVLSDNSVDHALLALACQHVGRPLCTVSSAYCRLTKDTSKIRGILETLDPALVYAVEPGVYGPAIRAWGGHAPLVFSDNAASFEGALDFARLLDVRETPAVQRAFQAIVPDDTAKLLLTSGSTGSPKVAINTHRMLTANQQQMTQVWPWLQRHPLRLLDWLPWSHTFGANHNFNMEPAGLHRWPGCRRAPAPC